MVGHSLVHHTTHNGWRLHTASHTVSSLYSKSPHQWFVTVDGIEYEGGIGPDRETAVERAAGATYREMTGCYRITYIM